MSKATDPISGGLASELADVRKLLVDMDEEAAVNYFGLEGFPELLKSTISLCPECLRHAPAIVFVREGRVLARKRCHLHGVSEALLENDARFYHLSAKDRWGRRYASRDVVEWPEYQPVNEFDFEGLAEAPAHCVDQWSNKSCTILVEVTNACNLACPVCYSDARGDRKLPFEDFKRYLEKLVGRKGPLDSVQLTGGEAVLHPEFWEMMKHLHGMPVKKIYLPTNGIAFSDREVAARLEPFRDKLMVLLQFDGQQAETGRLLRRADTARLRETVLSNLAEMQIQMQLTMTITQGVNEREIGWVVGEGLRHSNVKVVALQPVTYSGRYELAPDPLNRMTLSDCVKAVAAQVHQSRNDDFKPIPCSHPNCGWITLFVQRFGLTANVARHIDLERAMGQAANRTLLNSTELRSLVGSRSDPIMKRIGAWAGRKLIRSTDVFAVAIKPFMDRFNYDLDRISSCCHHLLDTSGTPVSFCEYNARLRPGDGWDHRPPVHPAA